MNAVELFSRFGRGRNRPLSMITCYDATFAGIAHEAQVDVLLVGDSLANVMLGLSRTGEIGMMEMLHHTRAVRKGAPDACVVSDLPYGADATPALAVANSRFLVQAGADAVKLEGCREEVIRSIVGEGIAVVGHLGLLPQTAVSLKQVGRTPEERREVRDQALRVQESGACALVLEHIPSDLGGEITEALSIPTVGIGAGAGCAGQVLVLHDLLGLSTRQPPFAPARVDLRGIVREALSGFHRDVSEGRFPPERS
ncbi:MAG TPA: 3-methyl-2-oxobutanoate hydroxymethyltransferase [Fibrobacteria bacterium]|nr:3-methyl-2-oxobutanoate hydroxymethyltransferase [Fibrobacteria bacterium]HOX50473.1 3-methyl-2-oxobutanoate hydroxymethyltransferase [Fibrobacteria bacterium]